MQNAVEDTLPLVRGAKCSQQALQFWTEGGDSTYVYWTDRRGRGLHLQATPIDVAATLRSRLMDRGDPVMLTSATLTVAGNFEYSQTRLGLENSRTLHVESLFNYGKQALLYVPRHLPDPRQREFTSCRAPTRLASSRSIARSGICVVHKLPADAADPRDTERSAGIPGAAAGHRAAHGLDR